MRCGDCKHFEKEEGVSRFRDTQVGFGHCGRWHEGYLVEISDVASNEAWVEDDEGWGNVVGPDFGCVLFEAK